jgi:hypothetical protein
MEEEPKTVGNFLDAIFTTERWFKPKDKESSWFSYKPIMFLNFFSRSKTDSTEAILDVLEKMMIPFMFFGIIFMYKQMTQTV